MARIYIEDIQKELEKNNWKIVSEKYKNLDSELIFLCPEGHRVYTCWRKLRNKRECPVCEQNIFKEQEEKVSIKKPNEKRVLALDQATRISGWSVYSNNNLLRYGTFETQLTDEIARDITVRNWLISMINNWKPDIVALEGLQYQKNIGVTTFEILARLQGILMSAVYDCGVECVICPTQVWRSHCGVKGATRADKKRSMQLLVKKWFDITVTNDSADAIGIGKYATEKHFKKKNIEIWE